MTPKFRVFDKIEKKMYYLPISQTQDPIWLEMSNAHWGLFEHKGRRAKRICGDADDSGVLMLSTGLHDENGVEIWEEDIIQWTNDNGGDGHSEPHYRDTVDSEVIFKNGMFCLKSLDEQYSSYNEMPTYVATQDMEDCQVIGNAYEEES